MGLIFAFRPWVSNFLFGTTDETISVYALGIMLPFMVITNFSMLVVRMYEKGVEYSALTIALKLLNFLFTILFLTTWERSFRSVVLAVSVSEICIGFVSLLAVRHYIHSGEFGIDGELLRRMLKFGLPLIPASLMFWLLSSADQIMLRVMYSYEELGLYSAAMKIVNVLSIVQSCFTLFWTPVAYRWYAENKENQYYESVGKIVTFIMISMCLVVLLIKNVVGFILGEEFVRSILIFPFLLLHPVMYTISECTMVGLGFSRKTGYNVVCSAIAAVFNLIANYLLIPPYGARGAALATGISYLIFFWARTLFSRKVWYKFPVGNYIFATVVCLVNCYAHTFFTGALPYIISAASLVVTVISYQTTIKRGVTLLKEEKEERESAE
jgi:O-antigen/teichoic acid export membrane protein